MYGLDIFLPIRKNSFYLIPVLFPSLQEQAGDREKRNEFPLDSKSRAEKHHQGVAERAVRLHASWQHYLKPGGRNRKTKVMQRYLRHGAGSHALLEVNERRYPSRARTGTDAGLLAECALLTQHGRRPDAPHGRRDWVFLSRRPSATLHEQCTPWGERGCVITVR